jgi:hypothetical protein
MTKKTTTKKRARVKVTTYSVCPCCRLLPKFCKCKPGAVAVCPICLKAKAKGRHFPDVDCSGTLPKGWKGGK